MIWCRQWYDVYGGRWFCQLYDIWVVVPSVVRSSIQRDVQRWYDGSDWVLVAEYCSNSSCKSKAVSQITKRHYYNNWKTKLIGPSPWDLNSYLYALNLYTYLPMNYSLLLTRFISFPWMYVVTGLRNNLRGRIFLPLRVKNWKHRQTFRPPPRGRVHWLLASARGLSLCIYFFLLGKMNNAIAKSTLSVKLTEVLGRCAER